VDTAITLLILVALLSAAILAWTGRKRFPLRIGLGNFFRRKTQVAIVVTGLLVGTAIISSSYVIQTTFQYTVRSEVFRTYDYVDEIIYTPAADGTYAPFNATVFSSLQAAPPSMPDVAGLAPRYGQPVSAFNPRSGLIEPTARLIGFDVNYELGEFVRSDGSSWNGAGLGTSEVIINRQLQSVRRCMTG